VYPQALATMAGSSFWALLFFFMLFTLGIDSTVRICQKIYPEIATYFSSADSRP
jgi:hypothetical protein